MKRLFPVLVLLAAFALWCLSWLPAAAQCYVSGTAYTYSYSAPVTYQAPTKTYAYTKPVLFAEPVYVNVPFRQYGDVLFQFVAAPSTPPPVVIAAPPPVAPPMPMPAAAPPPQHHYPQSMLAEGQNAALEARLARIEALLLQKVETSQEGPPMAAPGYPVVTSSLASKVALLQERCGQCHSGKSARDGVQLFDERGAYNPNVTDEEIYNSVKAPRQKMPKGPRKLSPDELALLRPASSPRERVNR
jgi:hypothetical protein